MKKLFIRATKSLAIFLAVLLALGTLGEVTNLVSTRVFGQAGPAGVFTTLFPNAKFTPFTFTATGQSKTYALQGWSMATISFTGVAVTTGTFNIQGSNDGGVTYYNLITSPNTATTNLLTLVSPGTLTITTVPTIELVNLGGFTNLKISTTGTFTATSMSIQVTATSNVGLF